MKITSAYKKDLHLAESRGMDLCLLEEPLSILLRGERLHAKYHDHPLRGPWKGHRDFHVQGDWVVIYRIENDSLVLVDTGTHADLFKK